MGAETKTLFRVDANKCIRCGRCAAVCAGMVLEQRGGGPPRMLPFERFGWRGCWRCGHCLAVCPTGAISIFGKTADDCPPLPSPAIADAMEEAAARHRYTSSFDDFYYTKMKQSEASVRKGDLLFCGAPHLFVAHVKATGRWAADYAINCNLATAYFELLANAHGLGTVIMSYPSDVLCELAPEAHKMLGIPEDHYMKLLVGFGYPEIPYARGVQKGRRKVHRWTEQSGGQLELL